MMYVEEEERERERERESTYEYWRYGFWLSLLSQQASSEDFNI